MIIVISGQDSFRSREFLWGVIENFKKKRDPQGLNVHWFDAKENNIFELKRQEGAEGLFGTKRLFVVEHIVETPHHPESIQEFLAARNTDEGNVVCFFVEGDLPPSGAGKLLRSAKYQYAFPLLSGKEVAQWVRERLTGYHAEMEQKALELFLSLCGNDLWVIDSELAKLSAYAQGRSITIHDLNELSSFAEELSSFALVDAVFARNQSAIARGIQGIEPGEELATFGLVAGQFRTLGWLKEYAKDYPGASGAAQGLGVHPFVVKKMTPYYSRLTFLEIETILGRLRAADGMLKSSSLDSGAVCAWALGS